ncbi:MAG: iron-only hydrogenase system regulator [Clostridiales bacterium]|nr:iron-only hydrogenase system regulator [Clostridiales bacterium]
MIAIVSIMVTDEHAADMVNGILHVYRGAILGRFGLPLKDKGVSVISVVLDAEPNEINALTGKLGKIEGVKAKAIYNQ